MSVAISRPKIDTGSSSHFASSGAVGGFSGGWEATLLTCPAPPMPFGTHDATSQLLPWPLYRFNSIVNVLPAQSLCLSPTTPRSIATSPLYA